MKTLERDTRPGLHLVKGTMGIFLANALFLPTGFVTAIFLARYLGPMYYGLFALASRLVIWIEWSGTSIFSSPIVKFIGEAEDWRPIGTIVARLYLTIGCGIAALLWILSTPLAGLFNEPSMARYLRLFAVDIPIISLSSVNLNILAGLGRFKELAQITACRVFARMVLIILFVVMGLSVEGAILGTIGASVVELLLSALRIRPSLFSKSSFSVRSLLRFGAPVFMSAMSVRIFRLDLFALKALGGSASQAGFYGAALNLSVPVNLYSASIASPLLSTLSHLFSKGKIEEAKEIGMSALRSILWLFPFAAIVAGAASEIVQFVLGKPYLSASPLLSILILAAVLLGIVHVSRVILIASNKPVWTFILTGPMVPLALMGHLALIPWLGPVGAALVTTVVSAIATPAALYAVYRVGWVHLPLKTFLRCGLCSGGAFALAILWPVSGMMIILKLLIIVGAVLLALRLLGEFTAREMGMLRSMTEQILSVGSGSK